MKLLEKATAQKSVYEPYKYVMQDASSITVGAKYTYGELLTEEQLNFKFRAIIAQYILKESDRENTLESELYYLPAEGFVYETFLQLKAGVKVMEKTEKKGLFGKSDSVYREARYSLSELAKIPPEEKERRGFVITELSISKLALMSFTL